MTARASTDLGLQPERTSLSWSRTSLAIIANGLLFAGRDLLATPDRWQPTTVAGAGMALVAAALVYLIGRRRAAALAAQDPQAALGGPQRSIALTGWTVSATCVILISLAILTSG